MIHRTFYPFLAFALILSLAVTFLTAQPQAARASSIIFVDADATSGANNGSSWTDAYTNLQSALAPALPGDEIWVAEGTYKPGASCTDTFTLKSGVALYGGFAGNEAVRSQRDWAAHPTVLSGDIDLAGSNDSYHIVTGSGTDTTAILDGFTVSGGNADGSGPDDSGGGMYNDGGDPTLRNITFSNNFATYGGGVYNTASNPSLVNVVFIANMAVDGSGIYNTSSNPTIVNTTFYDNSATNLGSAIGNWNNSNPTLSNSILWGNSVPSVHQIYSDNSTPTVRYSDIQGGFAGPGNISSNPQFVDAPNGDLRLKNTSAAIDAGDNTALPTDTDDLDGDDDTAERIPFDLVGSPRFVNHSRADTGLGYSPIVDMGAYENQTANTAPALDNNGSPTLVAIDEDDANIAGTLVSTIIASGAGGNPITDPDSGALEGLAVIGVDNTSGVWQYSVDGGSSWVDFGSVSNTSAVILVDSANDWIRFVPASNYYGTIDPGLTFRAWDCSASGSSGAIGVDVSTNGGTTAFSTATETASLTVNPVNDPPSITDIPDQTTPMNQPIGPVIFAVSDVDNPLPSLTISASSSDPGLVPNANILLSGNDANRTITITPQASQIGTTTITVAVSDGMVTVYETFTISITGAKVYLPMVQK